MTETFRILTVCTGNICRSPAVERLLTAALGSDSGVEVTSAGVRAVVGHPMTDEMAFHVGGEGAVVEGFAARQITEAMVRESDLVLALTREHRTRIVELAPVALRRTFTLLEFARLATLVDPAALPDGTPAERLRALLPLAAAQRGQRPSTPDDDDVLDPYGQREAVYAESFGLMRPAVETIARVAHG